MSNSIANRRPGWWYPYIFVAVFMVVLAVNIVFAISATSTFTGIETEQAYDKGLIYNQLLAKSKAQEALGWTVEATLNPYDSSNPDSHDNNVTVTFTDKAGAPVTGMMVKVEFTRPTKAGFDQSVEMVEQAAGRYVALAHLPLPGQWDMQVRAHKDDATEYQLGQRVLVP
jgi:nitrogen fixation protein FixH